jgi:hypothetical protein
MPLHAFRVGDKVRNVFTREIGTIIELYPNGFFMVRYDSYALDLQKPSWVDLVGTLLN